MNASAPAGDLKTLLARADDFAGRGDVRAAVAFYQSALKSARAAAGLDREIMADLQRAQSFVVAQAREFQQSLEQAVADAGSVRMTVTNA